MQNMRPEMERLLDINDEHQLSEEIEAASGHEMAKSADGSGTGKSSPPLTQEINDDNGFLLQGDDDVLGEEETLGTSPTLEEHTGSLQQAVGADDSVVVELTTGQAIKQVRFLQHADYPPLMQIPTTQALRQSDSTALVVAQSTIAMTDPSVLVLEGGNGKVNEAMIPRHEDQNHVGFV